MARNADATTTVGSTNGTATSARSAVRPGNVKRAKIHAAGIPTSNEAPVMAMASPTVNTMVSSRYGRPERVRDGSDGEPAVRGEPGGEDGQHRPREEQPQEHEGRDRERDGRRPTEATGRAGSPEHDLGPFLDPAVTVRRDGRRVERHRVDGRRGVLPEHEWQLHLRQHREHEHVERDVLAGRCGLEQEVHERPGELRLGRPGEDTRELDLAIAAIQRTSRWARPTAAASAKYTSATGLEAYDTTSGRSPSPAPPENAP